MSRIFEDDENFNEKIDFKTNNEYAKTYDTWRKKEELNKLKTKYGDDVFDENDSSSSSDDDEEGIELTEDVEKEFFKTLSCLKNKDPVIYKSEVSFFKHANTTVKPKKKDKAVTLKDYERNLILEKGGILSDEEDLYTEKPTTSTYIEEQEGIKESFKKALQDSDEEDDGILKQRKKTQEEAEKEESEYKQWLKGQKKHLEDKEQEKNLKPLKDYWNNPKLDEEEKFLRDYILNKKYISKEDDDNYIPTYDEIIHDSDDDLSNDENNLNKQEEFEYKYNFRYEEPDQEFIKRYPRTMENSVRKTDDKRKIKRQEIKERKKKEKDEKMQDLKKMQELKRLEIEEKLEKLKEITGNASLGFEDNDLDGDFDPEEHDRKMQKLFNDEFYAEEESDQKPTFPDIDEELEIENWERYNGDTEDSQPHCEDEDFNMDADYDPNQSQNEEIVGKNKKKRKRKSKFAKAVSKPKPKFDPADKKFEKYFEDYYKLDCEDFIGDLPCRFKYRKVVPNDFGLTTEEILLANERELNKWCSLKKAVQIRTDDVEKYEQIAYRKKGQNLNLKRKILPSLFTQDKEEIDNLTTTKSDNLTPKETKNSTPKETKNLTPKETDKEDINNKATSENEILEDNKKSEIGNEDKTKSSSESNVKKSKKKKKNKNKKNISSDIEKVNKKRKNSNSDDKDIKIKKQKINNKNKDIKLPISDARLTAYGINPKKYKNKIKYKK